MLTKVETLLITVVLFIFLTGPMSARAQPQAEARHAGGVPSRARSSYSAARLRDMSRAECCVVINS